MEFRKLDKSEGDSYLNTGLYKHADGTLYYVLYVDEDIETKTKYAIYCPKGKNYSVKIAPVTKFKKEIDKIKYPNAKQKHIFEFVRDFKEGYY